MPCLLRECAAQIERRAESVLVKPVAKIAAAEVDAVAALIQARQILLGADRVLIEQWMFVRDAPQHRLRAQRSFAVDGYKVVAPGRDALQAIDPVDRCGFQAALGAVVDAVIPRRPAERSPWHHLC